MTPDKFRKVVQATIKDFANENPQLRLGRSKGACERTICFRFGLLLARRIETKKFIVDSEYNVDLSADALKMLPDTGKTGRVFPDLIVHKRTKGADDNFAVIEVKFAGAGKKATTEAANRIRKFRRKYGYKVGVVIVIPRNWDNFIDNCVVDFI